MNTTQRNNKIKDFILNADLDLLIKESNQALIKIYLNVEPVPIFTEKQVKNIVDTIRRSISEYYGNEQYPEYFNKLSFIFYSIIKGHFLENGNKRTASDIFVFFLYLIEEDLFNREKFGLIFSQTAEMAIKIAESKPEQKDEIISNLENWIISKIEN